MKIFKHQLFSILSILLIGFTLSTCEKDPPDTGSDGVKIPDNYGTLEIDFKLPVYNTIQRGIRRVDLALCHTMDEMYRGVFFYHVNVSDAKEIYQVNLPEGRFFYQATVTCTCGGDSCIQGGFPYGYGGLRLAFDKVDIVKQKITRSQPLFQ